MKISLLQINSVFISEVRPPSNKIEGMKATPSFNFIFSEHESLTVKLNAQDGLF